MNYLTISDSIHCCAVENVHGINQFSVYDFPVEIIMREIAHRHCFVQIRKRFYLFTEMVSASGIPMKQPKRLLAIKEFIEKKGLGTCVITETEVNPNSGSSVACMLWTVDLNDFRAWYRSLKNNESAAWTKRRLTLS